MIQFFDKLHREIISFLFTFLEIYKVIYSLKGAKREEWMTELPQKMLRTGVFGLSAKTSFSRFAAGPSAQSDLWTKVANGEYKKVTLNYNAQIKFIL